MIAFIRRFMAAGAGVILSGCSPLVLLNAMVPSDGYSRVRDIAYGPGPRQRLDVYRANTSSGDAPVIVFFYGGSWKRGDRGDYEFIGEAFTRRGFVVVVPDYRVYPDVKFPAFVADAARAVGWTRANIRAYGGDPDRLFVAGHSAGAHIAALVALDPEYLGAVGLSGREVCGLVGLAGPYAFDPLGVPDVRPIFADLADPDMARPVTYAGNGAPPALLFHGTDDTTVKPLNSEALAKALARGGTPVRLKMLPGLGHVGVLLSLSGPFEHLAPTQGAIGDFVRDFADCNGRSPTMTGSR